VTDRPRGCHEDVFRSETRATRGVSASAHFVFASRTADA